MFRSLGFRIALVVALALAVGLGGFVTFLVSQLERDLIDSKREEASLLADTLKQTLKHAMLAGGTKSRQMIPAIIKPVAGKEIERVRIYNKLGTIRYSSDPSEAGHQVDRKADACNLCHKSAAGEPLQRIPSRDKTRIYESPGPTGHRLLGVIDPIYNEPKCYQCHPPGKQKVLGVLDVVMSLKRNDQNIHENARRIWIFGIIGTLLLVAVVVVLIHFLVHRPVKALLRGTEKVASLNLDHRISSERTDELGDLSRSFDTMTGRLKEAREELRAFSDGLEEKVREKTSELEAAQKQMIRAEKLAAIGHMAAGIAHEINNPLTGVITLAHLLKKKHPPDTREGQDLDTIIDEARRCSRIVRGLLDFARGARLDCREVAVNRLLDQALSLVENQALFHNIEIVREYGRDLPRLTLDEDRIEQVFLNLVLNAAEAMGGEGRLTLRTAEVREEQDFDQALRVEVSDTGPGIPEEIQGKVFDPFFTTKETGKGTGLGLAVSYGIVVEHGGRILVKSPEGEGATFVVYLPVAEVAGVSDAR